MRGIFLKTHFKILIIFSLVLNSSLINAALPEYLDGLPTSSTLHSYAVKKIESLISPLGYNIENNSLDISPFIAVGAPRLVRILNSNYSLRSVKFTAIKKDSNVKRYGHIYLIIVDKNISSAMLNSSYEKLSITGEFRAIPEEFGLLISKGIEQSNYEFDVSPFDLFR